MSILLTLMGLGTLLLMQPTTAPSDLTVMTFNIRYGTAPDGDNAWARRRELLFATIKRANPDLLGTQEGMLFQIDELRDRFKDYDAIGVGRDDGKAKGESTALFYRKDRFQRVDQGHFWLSETPDIPGSKSWDTAITRMVTWVKLRDRNNSNRELIFLNTHFDHQGEQARLESSRLIRARLRQLAGDDAAVIITADLNALEDSPDFTTLRGDDLVDAYRSIHPTTQPDEATFHAFSGNPTGRRIDYVVHTRHFHCTQAAIDRTSEGSRFPSDHFAVVCRLAWR